MKLLHERVERSLLKIFLTVIGGILLLIGFGFLGARAFHRWQGRRLCAEANSALSHGDLLAAAAAARRAFQLNPDDVDANRLLARISEGSGWHEALSFWRRASELSGYASNDVQAWTRSALRLHDAAEAERALHRLPAQEQATAAGHALHGDVALLRGEIRLYEKEVLQAQQLDPQNRGYALALATLHAAGDSTRAQGLRALEDLAQKDFTRSDATRRLAEDAIRHREWPRAVAFTKQLEGLPDRTMADRLLRLTALNGAKDGGLDQAIAELEKESATDADKVAAVMAWLTGSGRSGDAVVWGNKLSPELLRAKTVPLAFSDVLVAAREWKTLRAFLTGANWGPAEFMRNALLARAARELNDPEAFSREWREAARNCSARTDQVLLLAETAEKWGWQPEAVDLLWLAAKDPAKSDRSLAALYRYFAAKGDSAGLYRVLLHLTEAHPNEMAVKNNAAQLALLLDYDTERGHRLAREVYAAQPQNADFAATYAFSLWRQGETRKALQVLDALAEEKRQRPAIAAYYGIILQANGDRSRAREYLDLAEKANLLPEERELLAKARQNISAP